MKKIIFSLLTSAVWITSSHLIADVDLQDIGATNIAGTKEDDSRGPFKVEILADWVGRAKVDECRGHIQFATAEAEISGVFYHNPCYEEGASLGISYSWSLIDWKHNPFFHQKNFDEVCLTLAFSSKRLCDWLWQFQLTANFDNLPAWTFNDYMNYDMLMWGRYGYLRNLGIHIGFIAFTGMKIDRVYPIIGVDWQITQEWALNVVFPVNLSVVYNFNNVWSAALAGRLFYERHRLKKNEPISMGLIEYRNAGAEFALNYQPHEWLYANIHAGYSFGGKLKTAHRHHHHPHHYDIKGAPYAGAELDFTF